MEYGINIQSVIPCRAGPSHRSEMTTQLLFGERYAVLERHGEWLKIENLNDRYTSWIWEKQHFPITEKEFRSNIEPHIVQDFFQPVECMKDGRVLVVPPGAELHDFSDQKFRISDIEWKAEKLKKYSTERIGPKTLLKKAMLYLEAPYLWGGKTPWGIDCSGLMQMAFKLCGKHIPRDAKDQVQMGEVVDFVEEAAEGDLAFFHNEEGHITHVGMVASDRKIIHASGKVRMDTLDHYGIYNHELRKYTHYLRVIKRVL
ncbi:MAG: C40 family peptidase [Bacteroidia bacterium]|nr:C40 family peptidase [Bacteroidia bacterium]